MTRDRLIQTAHDLFYRVGFHSVGLDAIIAEVGVTKTTFYNHFDSKDGLVLEVLRWHDRWWKDTFRDMLKKHGGDSPRGQIMAMFALAIIYSTGLTLVGLKFAVAIGVVAGLVSFVPYLGFVFGILLAGLTVVLEPDPLLRLAGVVGTFAVGQFIEGSVLTPKLVGDRIGLHPVIVIFAVAAGGQLFGFFGILLALPAAAVLSVLARFAYSNYLADHPEYELEGDADSQTPESPP